MSPVLYQLLSHPLIWNVDWIKVEAGFFALVDPADAAHLLYISNKEYQSLLKVALSNQETLTVVARPGEVRPDPSLITAPKPSSQTSPLFFRSYRVYSRLLKEVWSSMWYGRMIVPLDRNIKILIHRWLKTVAGWSGIRAGSRSSSFSAGLSAIVKVLLKVLKHHGPLGLSLFLKISMLAVNRYLSGERLSSTWDLKFGIRLVNGLPSWLPLPVRASIRARSHRNIRLGYPFFIFTGPLRLTVKPLFQLLTLHL